MVAFGGAPAVEPVSRVDDRYVLLMTLALPAKFGRMGVRRAITRHRRSGRPDGLSNATKAVRRNSAVYSRLCVGRLEPCDAKARSDRMDPNYPGQGPDDQTPPPAPPYGVPPTPSYGEPPAAPYGAPPAAPYGAPSYGDPTQPPYGGPPYGAPP